MKLTADKWFLCLEINSARRGEFYFGFGWWSGSTILWDWYDTYYDGRHFSCRLGPFYFNRSRF